MNRIKSICSGQGPGPVLLFVFLGFFVVQGFGQENKEYILQNTNVDELQRLSIENGARIRAERAKALIIAKEKGWPTINLIRVDERGLPVYHSPTNNDHAATGTNTALLRQNLGVFGQGMNVGMWEAKEEDSNAYAARATHIDFGGRVTIKDGDPSPSSHATHVAGTLIGNAILDPSATGMATQATLVSRSSADDHLSMPMEASAGMLVSNHSYGVPGGWKRESVNLCFLDTYSKWTWLGGTAQFNSSGDDPRLGQYNIDARSQDLICHAAPMYLPVFASGNYNNQDPGNWPVCDDDVRDGISGTYVDYDVSLHPTGNSAQRSTISSSANAKNILTVGNGVYAGSFPFPLAYINESSSRGMTDDGRIKPDLCGIGTDIWSADSNSDVAHGFKTGTSMAAPNVAGSLLLLQEVYENYNGSGIFMRSATLKGLAIHSSTDLGNPGPDFTYGWGLLDANRAGDMIVKDAAHLETRILEIAAPTGLAYTFYSDGTVPIKVTLCYTDEAGAATSTHNDATAKLVNDLDLTLVLPGVATLYPYVLDMNNPSATATTGDNDRDNVEQIYVQNPVAGQFEVYVNVEGTLTGAQPYSLIVSGIVCENAVDINQGNGFITPNTYFGRNITSTGTVAYGTTVTHQALESIVLLPGFSGHFGSHYTGKIEGCE